MTITVWIFPNVDSTNKLACFGVGLCMLNWSMIEVVRFGFYATKALVPTSSLARFFGHLRYNVFIFAYVLGVTGELIAVYFGF